MGTNYFWRRGQEAPIHIGRSSYGWCFALHVDTHAPPRNLDEWVQLFRVPDAIIADEYGMELSIEQMIAIITKRSHPHPLDPKLTAPSTNAWPGPQNLLRRSLIDCVGHGDGTWDLVQGDFR